MCGRGLGHVEGPVYFHYEGRGRVWPCHCHAEAARPRRVREPSGRALARMPHAREPASFRNVDPFACPSSDRERGAVVRDDRRRRGVDRVDIFFRREDPKAGERARDAAASVHDDLPRSSPIGEGRLPNPQVLIKSLDSRHGPAVDESDGDVVAHFRPCAISPFASHPACLVAVGHPLGVRVDADREAQHSCHCGGDEERLLQST